MRAYATNSIGTSYGAEESFITTSPSVGQSFQGGILAYVLAPGDPGYNAAVLHGIIAAPSDLGPVEWGCKGSVISGADGTVIGTGNQNTIDIMTGCATAGIAARLCGDLVLNGYSDWYLPSIDELHILYLNQVSIGGFNSGANYWCSSEWGNSDAYAINHYFSSSVVTSGDNKNVQHLVRAIRSF